MADDAAITPDPAETDPFAALGLDPRVFAPATIALDRRSIISAAITATIAHDVQFDFTRLTEQEMAFVNGLGEYFANAASLTFGAKPVNCAGIPCL